MLSRFYISRDVKCTISIFTLRRCFSSSSADRHARLLVRRAFFFLPSDAKFFANRVRCARPRPRPAAPCALAAPSCARGTQGHAPAALCRVGLAARCALVPCRRQATRSQKRWARHGPTGIAFRSRFVILHRNMKSTKKSEYGTCRFFMFCSVCIRDFNI